MHLASAAVDRYGPLSGCQPHLGDGVTVLSGSNEAGKTLYLEAVLRLLDPAVGDQMSPPPRLSEEPTGRVVLERGGDRHDCVGETALRDFTPVEPRHLQSVFVVRDSDLALPDDRGYYTSLVETLGEVHTSEIATIKSALKERGRLTDRRLNVSSDRSHHGAGDVRDDASALAEEIREYTATVEDEGLDDLDARRLRQTRKLRTARDRLETQREAKAVAEHDRLAAQLETYRSTSARLADLEAFDRETLSDCREIRKDIERDREDREAAASAVESTEADVADLAESLGELEAREADLERRESAVEDARDALETYRDRQAAATGTERRLVLTKYATVAGLLGGGIAGVAGAATGLLSAVALGAALLATALASAVRYRRANRRLAASETARTSLLQTARDAGFDVESVEAVAPAIEAFESDLSQVRDDVARTDQRRRDAEGELADRRAELADLQSQIRERERRLTDLLENAGVETIEEYEARVDRREELAGDRRTARQSLVDRFGEPTADDPEGRVAEWEEALADLRADVDVAAVDAETYDESRHRELEAEVDRLEAELDSLEARLEEYDEALDHFDERARALETTPFVGQTLGLDARSKAGLEALASDLAAVVEQIEADADLSREALQVFERIEDREEEKLTTLFAPDGPASRTFEHLTGGRYTEVAYDADTHELVVERRDGRTLGPDLLSQGARDQLYFASRVSLARQLLGSEPGFLLLDDPFLAADADRLRRGFETLQRLAAEGWQVLYLTAKREVSETMVAEFDLAHEELDPIAPLAGTTANASK